MNKKLYTVNTGDIFKNPFLRSATYEHCGPLWADIMLTDDEAIALREAGLRCTIWSPNAL